MVVQSVVEVEGQKIFYREAGGDLPSPKGIVFLLHGMRFSSANWEDISTLSKLAEWNYRALAVDLPGYGNSKDATIPVHKSAFLAALTDALKFQRKPFLVSPSMSGQYSLPYLHDYGQDRFQGYIPVAPITTEKYTIQQYRDVKVPTFIVYGETDTGIGETSLSYLKHIPRSKVMMIKDAGHACYLDQPDTWHEYLQDILCRFD